MARLQLHVAVLGALLVVCSCAAGLALAAPHRGGPAAHPHRHAHHRSPPRHQQPPSASGPTAHLHASPPGRTPAGGQLDLQSLGRLWDAAPNTDRNLAPPYNSHFLVPSDGIMVRDLGWAWPYNRTFPLTTGLSTVRLLGGWTPAMAAPNDTLAMDVVYRCPNNGSLCYRFGLLIERLASYVANGMVPTVVLDNVPYAFVKNYSIGTYGQTKGPDDIAEYGAFLQTIVDKLVSTFGHDTASRWRFRVATEGNNPTGHWNDTEARYVATYAAAAAAVHAVLPGAAVGPSNWCPCNRSVPVRYDGFANTAMAAISAQQLPINFTSVSFYGHAQQYNISYAATAAAWLAALRQLPGFAALPLEVQEYGCLGNEAGRISNEPGSFGAAWVLATSVEFVARGVEKIFHWDSFSHLDSAGSVHLAHANLWLAAIGHRFRDGIVSVMQPQAAQAAKGTAAAARVRVHANADGEPELTASGFGVYMPANGSNAGFSSVALISAVFTPDRTFRQPASVKFSFACPSDWQHACTPASFVVTHIEYNRTTAPLDVALADLEALPGGGTRWADGLPYGLPQLANAKGWAYIQTHQQRYLDLQRATMAPAPFVGEFSCAANVCTAALTSPPHAVHVLHATFSPSLAIKSAL